MTTLREARDFTDFLHARFSRRSPERLRFDKLDAKAIALACGVETAQVLAIYDEPEDIDFDRPTPFVIKPTRYASKKGVRLIVGRNAKGQCHDAMHDVWLRPDTIVRKLRELIDESPSAGNRFLIEAWVTGANAGIPHDYKVYVIGGRAAFLLRVDRNTRPASLAFFDGDLAPLGDSDVLVGDTATRGDSTPPPNGVQLIATAERIATHVGVNFLGVDLYSDGERVLLGELTTVPGGPYYGRMFRLLPELDRALGERWRATNLAMGLPIPDVASEPPAKRSVGVR